MIEKVPVEVGKVVISRKLVGSIAAMAGCVALVLGLAAIEPTLFTEAPVLVGTAIAGILGLGGWQVQQQAKIDMNGKSGG